MTKIKLLRHTTHSATQVYVNIAKPTSPLPAKLSQSSTDPATGSNTKYPIPSFFEYRIKPKTYDPL